jgi:hypothetical protein
MGAAALTMYVVTKLARLSEMLAPPGGLMGVL